MVDHQKREKIPVPEDGCIHILIMIMRKKDNAVLSYPTIYRRILRHEEEDIKFLRAVAKERGGVWRIYRTVNKRSLEKANRLFKHRLIDDYDDYFYRLDSLWKTCLLQKESRAEKKFLVDVDDVSKLNDVIEHLQKNNVDIAMKPRRTPSGWHIVTFPFDRRIFEDWPTVEVDTDRFVFVERIGDE